MMERYGLRTLMVRVRIKGMSVVARDLASRLDSEAKIGGQRVAEDEQDIR